MFESGAPISCAEAKCDLTENPAERANPLSFNVEMIQWNRLVLSDKVRNNQTKKCSYDYRKTLQKKFRLNYYHKKM